MCRQSTITKVLTMNKMSTLVAAIALAAVPAGLQADPTVPVQSDNGNPSQQGFVLKELPFRLGHPDQYGAPRFRLSDDATDQTSGNWSGYAVAGDTFTAVTGSWVVPTVAGTAGSAAYTATWVGLDGYSDSTVEQCGTLQEWTGLGQSSYAWFEMYPNPMYEIEGYTVEPGDTITATVSWVKAENVVVGSGRRQTTETEQVFTLTMTDNNPTTGWTVTVGPSTGLGSYTTVPTAARGSAEWIMEAPTSGDILPLADFGADDAFSGCAASGLLGTGPIDSHWTAEPIIMEDPEGGESTPSTLNDTGTPSPPSAFTVTWSAYNPAPTRRFGR
jgi:hypothetical protein